MKKIVLALLLFSTSTFLFAPHSFAFVQQGFFQINSIQGTSLYWSNFTTYPFAGCTDQSTITIGNSFGQVFYEGVQGDTPTFDINNCTTNGFFNTFDFSTLPVGQYVIKVTTSTSGIGTFDGIFYCNGTFCSAPVVSPITVTTSPTQVNNPISTSASFTDLNASGTYQIDWDWGDGSNDTATVAEPNGSGSVSATHTYSSPGVYSIILHVSAGLSSGGNGGQGVATIPVTVNAVNTPPTVGTLSASVNPVQVNTVTTVSANFTDSGVLDTHTASWNWGDGNTTTGTVTESNGSGSVSDSHTYTSAGVYEITLTVTDNDGGAGTQTLQYLSAYNPTSQGLFSAGQHYSSPAGAYTQNTSLTGTVKFGLSYKYQGTVPTGNKEFSMDFNAANLHFNATTVSSLVIANGMGTLTGTGTVNGSGTYTFLVTGSESANTIRIQIKDSSNNVVYDTQPGAADTATPTISVTGHVIAH